VFAMQIAGGATCSRKGRLPCVIEGIGTGHFASVVWQTQGGKSRSLLNKDLSQQLQSEGGCEGMENAVLKAHVAKKGL